MCQVDKGVNKTAVKHCPTGNHILAGRHKILSDIQNIPYIR